MPTEEKGGDLGIKRDLHVLLTGWGLWAVQWIDTVSIWSIGSEASWPLYNIKVEC